KNLRLWAEGKREEVLTPHIEEYTDALERGWRDERDCLQKICNEFHAKFDWRLQYHKEPGSDKHNKRKCIELLNEVSDGRHDRDLRSSIQRIRRWYEYHARKLRKWLRSKGDPRKDPWAVLLSQLSGLKSPPKARQAYQPYMHEHYESDITSMVAERWLSQQSAGGNVQTSSKPTATFRAEVTRELFAALPENERARFGERAKVAAATARGKYDATMKAPLSRAPEVRQKCNDAIGNFLGPIQRGILEYTGLHSVVLMGRPIPKYGGEL
ncbi:hypothetical protein B0H16DRAFT_1223290, partial [Mycena metata]